MEKTPTTMADPTSTTLLARARAWDQRSLKTLADLASDMADVFDDILSEPSSTRQDSARELRAALDHLLDYTRPPKVFRVVFLGYRSVTMKSHKAARKVLAQARRELILLKEDVWKTIGRDEMVEGAEGLLEQMKEAIDENWGVQDEGKSGVGGGQGEVATSSSSRQECTLAGIVEKQDAIEGEPMGRSSSP